MRISRRHFITGVAASAASRITAQTSAGEWGGPVVDCHHHPRRTPEANTAHLDGAGLTNAMLLARAPYAEQFAELRAKCPGRYLGWFAGTDVTNPGADKILEQAVKDGAIGFGELKSHVEAAGPELRRLYALAGELGVPILVHFQEVPHTPTEGTFATGFQKFEAMLKAYPKTTFIGHADAFWANISADYANQEAYPAGKIVHGGITDKLLGDYANLFGDLAANSGNNALSRDPGFTADFLKRHQDKLIFGSDCSCVDGKGGGISQANNPAAARLAGKCVARETLALLKGTATPQMFRKLTWDNAHRVYKLASG
jgi:predicted TIM-barrel fold metal-dependent hydrolase